MSTVVAAGISDVGRVRDHNEDAFFLDPEQQLFLVADGMGGHAAGEVASQMAVELIRAAWSSDDVSETISAYAQEATREARRSLVHALRDSVMEAHHGVFRTAQQRGELKGMGTTLTGFVVAGGEAIFAHAGDSRAYLVRDGIALQLSEDHTVLARMQASGMSEDESVRAKRWKGVLTNALGTSGSVRIATFLLPVYAGDMIVLCSDGVHEYLSEAEFGSTLLSRDGVEEGARALIDLALERGGADNATAVVVRVVEADAAATPKETRERDEQSIALCPLLKDLSLQQRLRALRVCTPREIRPGRSLAPVALGERAAYILLEGEAKGPRGDLGPGDVVYPSALVDGSAMPERSAQVVAQSELRLLTLRRDDFREIAEEDSELGLLLYAAIARLIAL